jgi:uncharacterized protein (TIGR02145 family)
MTRAQRNAIVTPAAGLIVWCTNCGSSGELQINNGSTWTNLIGGPASFAVPDAPTSPVATAGNAQASVAFNAPASDGGSTITAYTVTSSPGGFNATGASSPIVVTGLANLTSYTFTVVATNAVGNSIPSVASTGVIPGTVIGAGGRIWMDRNLGATQVATSSTDPAAYGDLYQWGRGVDGHQLRDSPTTNTQSYTNQPGNGNFILVPISASADWLGFSDNNLWQVVYGLNNPCPSGYRIPTEAEWVAESANWNTWNNNFADGAFNSLKLTMGGFRRNNDGSLPSVGTGGNYWSSTVNGTLSVSRLFTSSSTSAPSDSRAVGNSVRCIMN